MIAIATALIGAMPPMCMPLAGASALWQPRIRWVIVGEMHGTNEAPDAFANLVCLAAKTGRPVTVALEYSSDDQIAIDAYLASDGSAQAQAALLRLFLFSAKTQDGRGSVAFLRLWEKLRLMKCSGTISGVVASDVGRSTPEGHERNAAMAISWTAIRAPANGIIISLVGNLHAMRKPIVIGDRTITPAGSLMPAQRTITVNIDGNGGKAWNCQEDGCAPHDSGDPRQAVRGIVYSTDADRQWDATYELGVETTAAYPANGVAATVVPGN
jgi:hypothetical protein